MPIRSGKTNILRIWVPVYRHCGYAHIFLRICRPSKFTAWLFFLLPASNFPSTGFRSTYLPVLCRLPKYLPASTLPASEVPTCRYSAGFQSTYLPVFCSCRSTVHVDLKFRCRIALSSRFSTTKFRCTIVHVLIPVLYQYYATVFPAAILYR